ncbi:interstitial collagenase-like [Temnothorax curvispinosus]|uniref:Interstitial collagenase-like n=1 Tax=Temnothorax curvispinosus TaxID=300111 RepID=A0A6J1QYI4_9HYME|nr:interstitial collagenase-like [Temnothorax curvispinosus]
MLIEIALKPQRAVIAVPPSLALDDMARAHVDAVPAQRQNDVLRKAFEDFQNYYDLPSDGTPNNKTLQLMSKPRCGFRDILNHGTKASLSKWPKMHLTWNFYVADEAELSTARAAFDLWSQHSALTFERSETNPDYNILATPKSL